tara:strand:+ start:2303 stop:3367 length:1065 start_codon:yes stop_codon:yes gene_type:complete
MKSYHLIFVLILFFSCNKEDENNNVIPPNNFGSGIYIVNDQGISFLKDNVLTENIFYNTNNITLSNPKKIKFRGTKAYIISDNITTVNVNNFDLKDVIDGFTDLADIDFISFDRVFAIDNGDSKVKVIDLITNQITEDIETGDNTYPSFIVSGKDKSFILNGGSDINNYIDSTFIIIDHKNNQIPTTDIIASRFLASNPSSGVYIGVPGDWLMYILCKGVYNSSGTSNIESSFFRVYRDNGVIESSFNLPGIYNARNLIESNNNLYFTSANGVYSINRNTGFTQQLCNINSDVLFVRTEEYDDNDSTTVSSFSQMLYVNDINNNSNKIYKFNVSLMSFTDTIITNSRVRYINEY